MISIYGTSHISEEVVKNIQSIVEQEKPDLVAIELDELRLRALLGEKGLKKKRTPLFFLLEKVQKYFGKKVDVMPGREMLEAYYVANEKNIPVALIDQDINTTMMKVRAISLKEKLKIMFAIIAIFLPIKSKTTIEFDIRKVPSQKVIETALSELKKLLPGFYNVLITERNQVMARKLKILEQEYNKILVFVGAGHVKELKELIKS